MKKKKNSIYKKGDIIILRDLLGHPNMPYGLTGVVKYVDEYGFIHMKWDNGETYSLNEGWDNFMLISKEEELNL
ncbi:MAG: DUF4314 domain-containing protein [Erysipelotrichaceae bacterium]